MKSANKFSFITRKWLRIIHRDLSFLFTGVIIIYSVSGIALNHKRTFNADYNITKSELCIQGNLINEKDAYVKHYYSGEQQLKIFIKGGSSLVVNLNNGKAVYESVKRRPILSWFSRLHYNPTNWWTWFSDIFAISLLIIAFTGLFINKGKNGIMGRGGIELIIGMSIPVIFLFL